MKKRKKKERKELVRGTELKGEEGREEERVGRLKEGRKDGRGEERKELKIGTEIRREGGTEEKRNANLF